MKMKNPNTFIDESIVIINQTCSIISKQCYIILYGEQSNIYPAELIKICKFNVLLNHNLMLVFMVIIIHTIYL